MIKSSIAESDTTPLHKSPVWWKWSIIWGFLRISECEYFSGVSFWADLRNSRREKLWDHLANEQWVESAQLDVCILIGSLMWLHCPFTEKNGEDLQTNVNSQCTIRQVAIACEWQQYVPNGLHGGIMIGPHALTELAINFPSCVVFLPVSLLNKVIWLAAFIQMHTYCCLKASDTPKWTVPTLRRSQMSFTSKHTISHSSANIAPSVIFMIAGELLLTEHCTKAMIVH